MWTLVLNATNWLVAGLGVAALAVPCRVFGNRLVAMRSLRGAALLLTVAAVLAGASVATRLVLGYAAPGAYAEEVAAARLLLDGRPVAGGEREAVREWLAEEQVSHDWLAGGLSTCQAGAAAGRARFFTSQGHPPFLLVASVPIVAWAGGRGLFVVVTALTLLLLAVAGWRLVTELVPSPAPWHCALAIVAIAGWQPVLAGLRQGDAVLMASALVVVAWNALRHGRAVAAGVFIGLAASVSLGVLLVVPVLALQRPRAALAALATVAGGLAVAAGVGGTPLLAGVAQAGYGAALTYAGTTFNYSLLGRVLAGHSWAPVLGVVLAVFCAVVAGYAGDRGRAGSPPSNETPNDRGVELLPLGCCVAVLGSPVAWSQHLAIMLLPLAILLAAQWRTGNRVGLVTWCLLALALALPDSAVRWTSHATALFVQGGTAGLLPLPMAAVIAVTAWIAAHGRHRTHGRTPEGLPLSEGPRQAAWAGGPAHGGAS